MSASTMLRPGGTPFDERSTVCLSYSESRYPRRAGWHALTSTTDTRWKLIASSEQELYDLQNDPQEATNVAADHAPVVQAMSDTLSQMQPADSAAAAVAPEAAERLRALGYASGSSPITSDDPQAANPAGAIGAWTAFEQALAMLQAGNMTSAVPALRRLVAEYPGAPVFHTTYAQALKEAGDPRAAVTVYRRAVARWPDDPAMFHDLAVAAREAGDLVEAARAEQAALALDGTSAMAHNGLGLLHADAGRSTDAAAAFDRATEQDPSNPSYWTNLGHARAAMTDGAGAETAYRRALDIDAEFADALNGLGTLRVQQRRAAEAVPLFERALRRDPALHEARLNLGIAYQESGDTARAAAAYRDVLATAPPSARRAREAAASLLKALR
jgi:tetratricopeptide (TPR) repeat protein